jgi:hypothetical protein
MLPSTGGSTENSQSAAPRKTADNVQTYAFAGGKRGFIFSCVGNLTDRPGNRDFEWTSRGAAMAHRDPEDDGPLVKIGNMPGPVTVGVICATSVAAVSGLGFLLAFQLFQ